jgi:hypothetical protein
VEAIKQEVRVPKDYLAICIRRGDKINEHAYVGIDRYAELINSSARGIRTIFIATDDARVIADIAELMPDYEFNIAYRRGRQGVYSL